MKSTRIGNTSLKVARAKIDGILTTRLPMDETVKTRQPARDLTVKFTDASVGYADSEEHIGKAIAGHREHAIISPKIWATNKATTLRR